MTSTFAPEHDLPNGVTGRLQQNGSDGDDGQSIIDARQQTQGQGPQQNKPIPPHHEDARETPHSSTSPSPSLASVAADLHGRVHSFLSEQHDPSTVLHRVQEQARISLSVVQDTLSRYSLGELSLSYNGGKDCLVLLILFLTGLHAHHFSRKSSPSSSAPSTTSCSSTTNETTTETSDTHNTNNTNNDSSIPAIYARPAHPFHSVESFVTASSQHYHLRLSRYTTNPPHTTLRTAFASYLSAHPHIRAIFVGTRRTDPHGANLTHFDTTDRGWPDFMRIHPVIDWHYAEIWAFIRHLRVEYCPLYDEGYTSLGGTDDTHPNPMLRVKVPGGDLATDNTEGKQSSAYRPAYELIDDDEERLGRD